MEYRIRTDESVTEAVVRAVSDHEAVPPLSLPPLYETIDTDALEDVFRPVRGEGPQQPREVSVTFGYCDTLVTVTSDETVVVEPRPGDPFAVGVDTEQH